MSFCDTVPHYRVCGDEIEEEFDQDRDTFLRLHQRHALSLLKRGKDRVWADRPIWDSFRTAYEEVMDGQETFLLKSWRTDITAPRQYAVLRGFLDITTAVKLPEEPLRDTLAYCFLFSANQLSGLVKTLQRTVAKIPPEELIPAHCSADNPEVSFAYLAEQHLRMLMRCCSKADLRIEKERLWDFFVRNRQEEELTVELWQHSRPCFS